MNLIESPIKVGRELFELNTAAVQKFVEQIGEEQKRYTELNREFGERLPEVKGVASFIELQREYVETLWTNAEESMKVRGDILKSAVEDAGEKVRSAFEQNEEAAAEQKAA